MTSGRLAFALGRGAVTLPPAGPVVVFHPPAGYDLSALPRERVRVVQTFRPDFDHFERQGLPVSLAPEERCAAAVVVVPRARDAARALIAQAAAASDGPVVVDGEKTDGVDALLRELRGRAEVGEVVAKAHGKVFAVRGGDFSDWAPEIRQIGGLQTVAGVFSAHEPDAGSRLLGAALPRRLPARVADLGAGWGYLSQAVLAREGVERLHLVEADHVALSCARAAIDDPRAEFHWADATRLELPEPLGAVVTNPPFHRGRRADPSLGRAFIEAAGRLLGPAGELWLVANRHLPYEERLAATFRDVRDVGGDNAFKIIHASHPTSRSGRRP